ncbi:hypothetical protein ACE1TF_04510 [Geomicrobium sp. JSM 1781026]|uniref:hypothetical protein n=1 Tax=Geomicrobium sp. JSM 1781026 TaxID=3344580 RepID=UPI0035C25F98
MNVSSFQELLLALAANAPVIIITNDIVAEGTATVNYPVLIRGASRTTLIQRSPTSLGVVFNVTSSGQLNLQNLIVDGASNSGSVASPLINTAGQLNITDVTLENSFSSFRGGAISQAGNSTTLTNAIISNCAAPEIGGAIYVGGSNSALTINDTTVLGSFSGSNGGAIYINQTTTLRCTNVTFSENIASTNGGALFANINTSTIMTNCRFFNNQANNGGAIFVNPTTIFELRDSEFNSNSTSANGGAVYLNNNSNSVLSGNSFVFNTAANGGGIFLNNSAIMNLSGSTFTSNAVSSSGAGIFLNTNTESTISACTFFSNASTNAGAIYVNFGATLQLVNSFLDSNSAANEAGGVFINTDAVVSIINTEIDRNTSDVGGAISINTGGNALIQNGTILDNSAATQAGAIFNLGTLTLSDQVNFGSVGSNEAPIAPGILNAGILNVQNLILDSNGLFIATADNVVRIINPLLPGSIFQLDTTDYVFPDPERSPIVIAIPTETYPVLTQTDADAFLKPVTGFEDWNIQLLNNQVVLVFNPSPGQNTITYLNVLGDVNPNPTSYQPEDLPIILQDPGPVEGFEFIGWFDAAGNQVTVIPEGTTGDIVLFARYRESDVVIGDQVIQNKVRIDCDPCDCKNE